LLDHLRPDCRRLASLRMSISGTSRRTSSSRINRRGWRICRNSGGFQYCKPSVRLACSAVFLAGGPSESAVGFSSARCRRASLRSKPGGGVHPRFRQTHFQGLRAYGYRDRTSHYIGLRRCRAYLRGGHDQVRSSRFPRVMRACRRSLAPFRKARPPI
jgi:hypothetical protein